MDRRSWLKSLVAPLLLPFLKVAEETPSPWEHGKFTTLLKSSSSYKSATGYASYYFPYEQIPMKNIVGDYVKVSTGTRELSECIEERLPGYLTEYKAEFIEKPEGPFSTFVVTT